MSETKNPKKDAGSLFIPAGIMIGMGIGALQGNFVGWMFVGLGLGFIGFAITLLLKK